MTKKDTNKDKIERKEDEKKTEQYKKKEKGIMEDK